MKTSIPPSAIFTISLPKVVESSEYTNWPPEQKKERFVENECQCCCNLHQYRMTFRNFCDNGSDLDRPVNRSWFLHWTENLCSKEEARSAGHRTSNTPFRSVLSFYIYLRTGGGDQRHCGWRWRLQNIQKVLVWVRSVGEDRYPFPWTSWKSFQIIEWFTLPCDWKIRKNRVREEKRKTHLESILQRNEETDEI